MIPFLSKTVSHLFCISKNIYPRTDQKHDTIIDNGINYEQMRFLRRRILTAEIIMHIHIMEPPLNGTLIYLLLNVNDHLGSHSFSKSIHFILQSKQALVARMSLADKLG